MKRVLIIAYYFPPAGGSGVQRVLRMTRHLPARGWLPTVITTVPHRAALPSLDPGLLDEIPDEVSVHRVAGPEPFSAYTRWIGRGKDMAVKVGFTSDKNPDWRERFARWIRANVFVPDARLGWSIAARRAAFALAEDGRFDAVLTSGPPHSTHLAGRALARRLALPWIADFRDLWPDPNYAHHLPTTAPVAALDRRMRQRVLADATAVVAVSHPMAASLGNETSTPVHVIENGFESADFPTSEHAENAEFVLLHAGSLPSERDPHSLWEAISNLVGAGDLESLRVDLVGDVDARVRESVDAAGLSDFVTVTSTLPHADIVRRMARADALLLPIPRVPGAEGIITGKVFEYVGSGRYVIGVGPVGGEADRIIQEAEAGTLFDFSDVAGIESVLRTLYGAWRKGVPLPGSPREKAASFSREARAGQLAELLDSIAMGAV